jgi:hypothetical protein
MLNNLETREDKFEILNNDELKGELLEVDLLMLEEEIDEDYDEKIDIEDIDVDDADFEDREENVISSISHDESESELDIYFKYGTNNHKLDGKHSLKRDTILNGKLVEPTEAENEMLSYGITDFEIYDTRDIPIEKGSIFEEESRHADELQNKRQLAEDVYYLLKNNTDLDFRSNRRKPNKATFNNYYKMLLINIDSQYTKNEIFVELAYYFTDNIFNMYKLLDKKYAIMIIKELKEKGHLKNLDDLNFS